MDEPKVIGLAGVGLQVPDLAVAEKFYGAFGLAGERRGCGVGFRSAGRTAQDADDIVVLPGSAQKRIHHISFTIRSGDEDAFEEKLRKAGLEIRSAPDGAPRLGLWFQDPWGTWINLSPGISPYREELKRAEDQRGVATRDRVDVARWLELNRDPRPARIGHLLIFTPEFEKSESFFSSVLGLRTTDRASGKAAFMAAGDGVVDHHCFGLVPSTHRGLQHASFQVAGIDDIGLGLWRMRQAGYKESFGPGRHALASNLFHYIRDPWGSWVEYYADMDRISSKWQCRNWNELPYIWGPEWAPEFWTNEMNGNNEPK